VSVIPWECLSIIMSSLAGRTVSQSSMLAMQAEAGIRVCVLTLSVASSMFRIKQE